jgi:hypothetical protein
MNMPYSTVPAVRLAVLGVVLWVMGVAGAHLAAPFGVFAPGLSAPLLLATLPMAWGSVRLARRITGLDAGQLVEGVALVALPAALLDGVALTWMPALYAADAADQRAVAAWLLWFLGASFAIALAMSRRKIASMELPRVVNDAA